MRFVLPGGPFEAHEDSRTFTVGPNGKPVVRESHSIVARDFDGRLYLEVLPSRMLPPGHGGSFVPNSFVILDPVTRTRMTWTKTSSPAGSNLPPGVPGSRTVVRNTWNPIALRIGKILRQDLCEGPHPSVRTLRRGHVTQYIRDLGTRMIDGVEAQGCLVTNLRPGDPAKKLPPDTVTNETWASPLLHIILLSRHRDRRSHTYVVSQLDDLVLGSPDPNLFTPPPDYKIFDLAAQRRKEEAAENPLAPGGPQPDELAGVWEAEDPIVGKGVVIGFSLQIDAREKLKLQFHQRRHWQVVSSGPAKVFSMSLRLYERDAAILSAAWLDPNHDPWSTWDGRRLIVKYTGEAHAFPPGAVKRLEPLGLDLSFDPRGPSWVGTYTRNGQTKPIRLLRPGAPLRADSNPFVGAWADSGSSLGHNCFQIAQGADGALIAWSDATVAVGQPGTADFGKPDRVIPGMLQERLGERRAVRIDGDLLELTSTEEMAGVASGGLPVRPGPIIHFSGKLSPDGREIVETVSGTPRPLHSVYRKVASGSCAGFAR